MPIAPGVAVPLAEIELRATRSSGPGGQHANVTASRVEAVFDVSASTALRAEHKARIVERLGQRPRAVAQEARGQARNRETALERLRERLAGALRVDLRTPPYAAEPGRAGPEARGQAADGRAQGGPPAAGLGGGLDSGAALPCLAIRVGLSRPRVRASPASVRPRAARAPAPLPRGES